MGIKYKVLMALTMIKVELNNNKMVAPYQMKPPFLNE